MGGNIRTRPTTQAYRDGWDRMHAPKEREFCVHCGAGVGEHRREGEGTCPKCDPSIPPSPYDDKFADLRQKMADDVEFVDMHDDLRDHAEWLWGKFIDRLTVIEGFRPENFLGGIDRYKKEFMAVFDDATD